MAIETSELNRIPAQYCRQLNGSGTCEGCPAYWAAKDVSKDNPLHPMSKNFVFQIRGRCAPGAEMNIDGLGLPIEKPEPIILRRTRVC